MTGAELKKLRLKYGLTQQALGEAVGLKKQGARIYICKLETGKKRMSGILDKSLRLFFEKIGKG